MGDVFQIALNATKEICNSLIEIHRDLKKQESEGKITPEEREKFTEIFCKDAEKAVDKIWNLYWEYTYAQRVDRDCSFKN